MSTPLALHLSDGLLGAGPSIVFAVVAAGAIGLALAGARRDLDDRTAPLAGLVAAFVFAAQMINFPVLPGVSGHLVGGALAAILVGPWLAMLSAGTVVVLQALLFADGGLTALGPNVVTMAIVSSVAGFGVAALLRRPAAASRGGLAAVAFLAASLSVLAAALALAGQLIVGGPDAVSPGGLTTAILGVHLVIGLGEGVITALTVTAVARTRPDLVYLLHHRTAAEQVAS